jgi:hypothetical protein
MNLVRPKLTHFDFSNPPNAMKKTLSSLACAALLAGSLLAPTQQVSAQTAPQFDSPAAVGAPIPPKKQAPAKVTPKKVTKSKVHTASKLKKAKKSRKAKKVKTGHTQKTKAKKVP